jgi:lipid II:glycine glycyltransferase (peptidoglycan interpeptide bridge formation enzyme)
MATLSAAEWDRFLLDHPQAHLLQTSAWGELKRDFGWQVERVSNGLSGAQLLFRRLPLGFSFAYLPKGPLGPDWPALWPEIDRACRRRRAVLLKVEPDLDEPLDETALACFAGFRPSEPVQPRRTLVISLEGEENEWLERMKQKTRYNIRLAERKEVQVHPSSDLAAFYDLMQVTGGRDGFGIHSLAYYRRAYELFHPRGQCELLMADYAGRALAGLMVFAQGKRAWYLYGASNDEERSRMPTYLLQWEAMRWAARHGCQQYDLVGVPDAEEEQLEAEFAERSDGLWGVYRFKRGFGGQLVRSAGAWDRAYLPFVERLYAWWNQRRRAAGGGGE